jgi:multiple sugar transport system ATP-binding protein
MAEIRIQDLTKIFPNGTVAVRDLNLDIADGELLVLLGPSGCGKTTTLRCVAGLETQTSGDIWIGDRVVNNLPPGERDIAFVFQFYALYPHLSAYDNIAFPLRATRVPKGEADERVRAIAETLRISHILRKRPQRLPSGEQQRVALGRAIIRRPQAFLMDEPLTNLDAALRADMRVELKHLQHELGTTMLYVTHDQTEAMTMGKRIAVMNLGVLQQVGTPLAIYERPNTLFVAGFVGDPPMNLIPMELVGDVLRSDDGQQITLDAATTDLIRAKQTGHELVLGIRAEDIRLMGSNNGGDLRAEIATREPLGDQTLYSVALNGQFIQVTTAPTVRFELRETVELHFDRSRIRVFDAATEQALV